MNNNDEIIILEDSHKCNHSFELNDLRVPQCTNCLCFINWNSLRKYLMRIYGATSGEIEYNRLKHVCYLSRKKDHPGVKLVRRSYFNVESNREMTRYFYYEQHEE